MAFDAKFAIDVMYPAATAAYTIMTAPAPALPVGFQLKGAIEARPQDAQAAMTAADPKQQRIANSALQESNIFGLVAWNASNRTALVAFRGTQTIWDWIDDIDAVPVPYLAVAGSGLVHMGFQLVYEHIRGSMAQLLAGCAGAQNVLVTGHSLGGALAILGGFQIARSLTPGIVPLLYTFAGPRTGAPDFAGKFNAAIPVTNRIVNFMDVVPQVPLPPAYEHVGQETEVHGGFKPLDIAYAHDLTTYLTGLQKLLPVSLTQTAKAPGTK
ncbi:MAG TPA: lipase family protein [Bryobacteraceae bacterium]|nr:lipase family protein [Bryobacteraceae bacterium]